MLSSLDEGALVRAAKEMGVVFKARTPKSIIMEVVSCVCAICIIKLYRSPLCVNVCTEGKR